MCGRGIQGPGGKGHSALQDVTASMKVGISSDRPDQQAKRTQWQCKRRHDRSSNTMKRGSLRRNDEGAEKGRRSEAPHR